MGGGRAPPENASSFSAQWATVSESILFYTLRVRNGVRKYRSWERVRVGGALSSESAGSDHLPCSVGSPITAKPQSIRQLGKKLQTRKVFSSLLAPLARPSLQECGDDKRQVRKGDHAAKNLRWLDHVVPAKLLYGGHPRIDPESGMLSLLCVDAFLRHWHYTATWGRILDDRHSLARPRSAGY